jgi:hypothetical protein
VRYPNVTLSTFPQFETDLKRWFHRTVPIWITEYGHETKPLEPHGVSLATQAKWAKQALTIARRDPNVQMFIWFTFRDNAHNPWQSGLETTSGSHKPAYAAFSSVARLVDGVATKVKPGSHPTVAVYVPMLAFFTPAGTTCGLTYVVRDGSKFVATGQPAVPLRADQTLAVPLDFTAVKGHTYTVTVNANDPGGHTESTTASVVAS